MVAHKIKDGRRADCSRKLVEAGDVLINFLYLWIIYHALPSVYDMNIFKLVFDQSLWLKNAENWIAMCVGHEFKKDGACRPWISNPL